MGTEKNYKLVIFDLDGTLTPPRASSADPFENTFLPNVREKVRKLQDDGVEVAIASNQLAVGRGEVPYATPLLFLMWIDDELGIPYDMIFWEILPTLAKPNPNMLLSAMMLSHTDPKNTLMVGDDEVDMLAAEAAGVDFQWAGEFFQEVDVDVRLDFWFQELLKDAAELERLLDMSVKDWGEERAKKDGETFEWRKAFNTKFGATEGWAKIVLLDIEHLAKLIREVVYKQKLPLDK